MSLYSALSDVATEILSQPGSRPQIDDIVAAAHEQHGDLFSAEADRLMWSSARRIVKDILHKLTVDDTAQLALPGLKLPSAIAISDGTGGVYYVQAKQATWPELLAGETTRVENVAAARLKLRDYREVLDRLRPVMESRPSITVTDAAQELAAWHEAAAGDGE